MKISKLTVLLALVGVTLSACRSAEPKKPQVSVLTDNIRFSESVLLVDSALWVTNFGTESLNPLNTEGKGYIVSFADSASTVLIPADRVLSGPKGTALHKGKLYVADVNKLVVYQMDSLGVKAPVIYTLPANDLFVNDVAFWGDKLYVTVTNTGNIYTLDTANAADTLALAMNVVGANGIVVSEKSAYVASYPADGNTTPDNVIYFIEDLNAPMPVKFLDRAGQYDGLALSDDLKTLYFTNWVDGEVGAIDLSTKAVTRIDLGEVKLAGPARLVQKGGVLYIPDLPNNRVVKVVL